MGPTGSLDRKPTAGQPGPQGTGAALLRGAPARNPGLPFVCVHVCMCERVCTRVKVCARVSVLPAHRPMLLWKPAGPSSPLFSPGGSEVR